MNLTTKLLHIRHLPPH